MSAGRPTKYDPEFCERVVELGREGKSKVEIAVELGVVKATLDNWSSEHPLFLAAMTRAKQEEQVWWERKGRENLEKAVFQASMWSRSMAARFPDDWRETTKNETEISGKGGGPVTFTQVLGSLTQSVCPTDDTSES